MISGQRQTGSVTASVTVEGGWDETSSAAEDWVDVNFTLSLANNNLTEAGGGAFNAQRTNFPYYRVKLNAAGACSVKAWLGFIHH